MGKNGDLLRAMKAQKKTFTFTKEQLQEHDKAVRAEVVAQMEKHYQTQIHEYENQIWKNVQAEWNERTKAFNGDIGMTTIISMMASLPAKILIEHFGWKPVKDNRKNNTRRFCELLAEEITNISVNERSDIRTISKDIADKYGISFMMEEYE